MGECWWGVVAPRCAGGEQSRDCPPPRVPGAKPRYPGRPHLLALAPPLAFATLPLGYIQIPLSTGPATLPSQPWHDTQRRERLRTCRALPAPCFCTLAFPPGGGGGLTGLCALSLSAALMAMLKGIALGPTALPCFTSSANSAYFRRTCLTTHPEQQQSVARTSHVFPYSTTKLPAQVHPSSRPLQAWLLSCLAPQGRGGVEGAVSPHGTCVAP